MNRTRTASAGDSVKLVCLNACFFTPADKFYPAWLDCVIECPSAVQDKRLHSFGDFLGGLGSAGKYPGFLIKAAQILLNAQQGQIYPQILPNPRAKRSEGILFLFVIGLVENQHAPIFINNVNIRSKARYRFALRSVNTNK